MTAPTDRERAMARALAIIADSSGSSGWLTDEQINILENCDYVTADYSRVQIGIIRAGLRAAEEIENDRTN